MAHTTQKVTLRDKLAVYEAARANSEPLPKEIAPYVSSNSFRTQANTCKPKAKNWNHRLSTECLLMQPSTLKASERVRKPLGTISLATARPTSESIPWNLLAFQAESKDGSIIPFMSCQKREDAYDLGLALNYGYASGSPQLLRFITEHVELIHDPQYQDWEVALTSGSTSALDIVFRMLCDRGDWLLVENYSYPGGLDGARAQGINLLGIEMDEEGLLPSDLDFKLRTWDKTKGKKPRVLYTIPSGQNPTGTTQSTDRRKAIYDIGERHDLCIVEDDPYYFLQFERIDDKSKPLRTSEEYLSQLPVSYLSLDSSGRVLRLDSASKILAPGLRCGWITGCSQLIAKFLAYTEMSTVSPSGPSQVMLYKLLDETWGHEGFINWLNQLSIQYCRRRDSLVQACKRYLPLDICSWMVPTGSMFLWIRVDLSKHPRMNKKESSLLSLPGLSIEEDIHTKAKVSGVSVTRGSWFAAAPEPSPAIYFRMTFAAAPPAAFDEAVKRFGDVVCQEFGLESDEGQHLQTHIRKIHAFPI